MIIKLNPAFKSYLWGGNKLRTLLGKKSSEDILAETWELSCHPDGQATVANGADAGITLQAWIDKHGRDILGKNCNRFKNFPILVKLIDAKHNLSIQVHPADSYAIAKEGQYGKTEMWYVLEHEPGAILYHGTNRDVTKKEFETAIENGTLISLLRAVEVKKGDVFFIEAGTIHAIGAGIVIAEIQQNSNLTYRVFDYNRVDANGNSRQLHVKQALEVSCLAAEKAVPDFAGHLAFCEYFTVDKLSVRGTSQLIANEESFHHLLVVGGSGRIECAGDSLAYSLGDSIFVSAGAGKYNLLGDCELLLTTVPEK